MKKGLRLHGRHLRRVEDNEMIKYTSLIITLLSDQMMVMNDTRKADKPTDKVNSFVSMIYKTS